MINRDFIFMIHPRCHFLIICRMYKRIQRCCKIQTVLSAVARLHANVDVLIEMLPKIALRQAVMAAVECLRTVPWLLLNDFTFSDVRAVN